MGTPRQTQAPAPPGISDQQPNPQPLYAQPQIDPSQIRVTPENLFQAAAYWKGGQAHRIDTQPCPQCGSGQFYSRRQQHSRLPPPAPHCYNCGYNGGLFEQGDPSTWGMEQSASS
jgi:predicted RNA-binding Zn-ribbon protein involved in translation (DUF1610 family)